MAIIETWLRQDLKAMVNVRSLQGQVFSLDNGGNLIGVKVTRDGEPVELEGTIAGYCILPDGETINITPASGNTGIQNGNEAYVILPQLAYSVPGQISIVIKLAQGSSVTTLAACTGYVYKSRTSDEVVPPGTPIPDLQTLEEAISNANAATSRANTAAAAAENVDASMSKSGDVITITVTDRDGVTRTETLSDQSDAVEELQNAIATKAEQNGYYPDMTVGTAEQLVSDEGVTEAVPYLYRKSGGGVEVGNREKLEKIIGGTVAWNQLERRDRPNNTVAGIAFTQNEDGSITLNGTATGNSNVMPSISGTAIRSVNGHVYLGVTNIQNPSNNTLTVGIYNDQLVKLADESNCIMYKSQVTGIGIQIGYRFASGTVLNNVKINGNLFDLTQMFGTAIADYIYSLEQATAGAGVAWFRKLFPADYYPYNVGELISVSGLSEHKMVGFNLWDEETEPGALDTGTGAEAVSANSIRAKSFIRVFSGATYYAKTSDNIYINYYNIEKEFVRYKGTTTGNATFTIPDGVHYIRIWFRTAYGTIYKNDTCINLSDPSRNGEYEPYEKHSYPFDSSLTLRGIPKLDANNKLYYDGDEYAPDGTVTRRYGVVDLGTLNWTRNASGTNPVFVANMNDKKVGANFVCMYPNQGAMENADLTTILNNKACATHVSVASVFCIRDDSYTDAAAFKTAMSGVMLVYELATPTTEQSTPYNPVQVVDPYGTEEFVSTSIVPVGHNTKYIEDSIKKLEDTIRKLNDNVITESVGPAPIVSIKDGADGMPLRNLSVAVEPVQDLHGYDHPWPAGGGKNLLDESDKSIVTTVNGASITYAKTSGIMLKAGNSYTFSITGITSSPNGIYFRKLADNSSVATAYNNDSVTATITEDVVVYGLVLYNQGQTQDAWGNIKAQIELGSTATAWTPYSNICPITGWTGAKIFHCADNLYDKDSVQLHKNWINTYAKDRAYFYAPVTPGETYYISVIGANTTTYIGYIEVDQPYGGTQSYSVTMNTPNVNVVRTMTNTYIGLQFSSSHELTQQDVDSVQISISKGGFLDQVDITFPSQAGTVYGGTLTLNPDRTGMLVVDRTMVNAAELAWYASGASNQLLSTTLGFAIGTSIAESISEYYKNTPTDSANTLEANCYSLVISNNRIYVNPNGDPSVYGKFVISLASPQTYQLTAEQVSDILTTLYGTNNIWADTGDTTITYPADTKLYIDNKITQAIAAVLNA